MKIGDIVKMATGAKAQKDCPHFGQPKLLPRPTAASAARAAKNAMNRYNSIGPSSHSAGPHAGRTSPTRMARKNNNPSAQAQPKVTAPDRQVAKSESKPSVKATSSEELEPEVDFIEITGTQDNKDEKLFIDDSKAINEDDCQETHFDNVEITPSISFAIGQQLEQDTEDNGLLAVTPELPSSRPQTPISLSHSHPPTPTVLSRPTTPCVKSGPTTPCTKSRPSTPRHSCNKSSSQPITLPSTRHNDKRTKSSIPTPVGRSSAQPGISPPAPVQSPPQPPKNEEEDLMSVFSAKEKEFQKMKRELDIKQQAVIQVFENLRNIRERMTREGMTGAGEGAENLELKMFDVAGWSEEELARLCKDKITERCTEGAIDLIQNIMPVDEVRLTDLEKKAATLGDKIAEFCLEGFKSRQELLDWVQKQFDEKGCQSKEVLDQIDNYNNQGLTICESLSDLKEWTDNVLRDIALIARQACHERDVLWNVGDTLVREVFRLRATQEQFDTAEIGKTIEEIRQQLEEERGNREKEKEKLATAESQLKQARARISKMDRQIREAEFSIANSMVVIKNKENEIRQKDLQFEAKARKLREALKTGEVTNNYICQQRNTLTQEVQELKEKISTMTKQYQESVNELEEQIKTLKQSLEEQIEMANKETHLKNKPEELVNEHLVQIKILQAKIYELECLKPNPETPTEREMELRAELQATKEALHLVEDEISACKREKIRFLETLTKIAESDNKVGIQQKLAAELLNKEECLNKMQVQIRELTKNIKVNEQKVVQYEQYIQTLLAHIRNVAIGKDSEQSVDYAQLQNEIMVVRVKLLEAERHVEELTDQLSQRDQQIDQQGKTSRAQARVIKVREELINMLKNKESEQTRELSALQKDLEHRMKIVDEVNHQIAAKADEIQELFTTLESKQQQIHRLEKIVLALEEQQRRAQAQRTRHEEKIAALEHELAAGGSRRERKDEATSPKAPGTHRTPSRNLLITRNRYNELVINWHRLVILLVGIFLLCLLIIVIIATCMYIVSLGPKTRKLNKRTGNETNAEVAYR